MDQKKADQLPKLNSTLRPPPPAERQLELDELWSFVHDKLNQCWVWIALCVVTKQVVAVVAGGRGIQTCRALWREIPWRYRNAKCYSDFWEAYQAVIPSEQHEAVGKRPCPKVHFMVKKESGLTNHVERWNNTLRQRLGQFVRKRSRPSGAFWDQEDVVVLEVLGFACGEVEVVRASV